jgi:hypothetical protein
MMEEETPQQPQDQESGERELKYPVFPTISDKTEIGDFSDMDIVLGFESLLHNHTKKSTGNLTLSMENYHEISQNPLSSMDNTVLNQPLKLTLELSAI